MEPDNTTIFGFKGKGGGSTQGEIRWGGRTILLPRLDSDENERTRVFRQNYATFGHFQGSRSKEAGVILFEEGLSTLPLVEFGSGVAALPNPVFPMIGLRFRMIGKKEGRSKPSALLENEGNLRKGLHDIGVVLGKGKIGGIPDVSRPFSLHILDLRIGRPAVDLEDDFLHLIPGRVRSGNGLEIVNGDQILILPGKFRGDLSIEGAIEFVQCRNDLRMIRLFHGFVRTPRPKGKEREDQGKKIDPFHFLPPLHH